MPDFSESLPVRVTLAYGTRVLELPPGEYVLGRSSGCALRFASAHVSRQHARVTVDPERASVQDLGSKNGTLVNGIRIHRRTDLAHGDKVELGRLTLTVSICPESEFFEEEVSTVTGQAPIPILDADSDAAAGFCPACDNAVPEGAVHCPHCGCKVVGKTTCFTQELPLFDPDG